MLGVQECRRLLASGVGDHRHGHVGLPDERGPVILPVDYAMHGPDVVLGVGERLFARLVGRNVAFQVDGVATPRPAGPGRPASPAFLWSVLVRGLAIEETGALAGRLALPETTAEDSRLVRIRADVVTGRRFELPNGGPGGPADRGVDSEGDDDRRQDAACRVTVALHRR